MEITAVEQPGLLPPVMARRVGQMSQLTFKYEYDESFFDERLYRDDFGRLTVSVQTGQFSGWGGIWVQCLDVKSFGESLSRSRSHPTSR